MITSRRISSVYPLFNGRRPPAGGPFQRKDFIWRAGHRLVDLIQGVIVCTLVMAMIVSAMLAVADFQYARRRPETLAAFAEVLHPLPDAFPPDSEAVVSDTGCPRRSK